MFLKLAWLNIWRNKRRTLITTASVFFAVLLAIATRSMTNGIYENMIHNVVSYSSGYIQIHKKGFWDEQSIDNTFEENKQLSKSLLENSNIGHLMPRLETFALASFSDKTKGVLILGIDPEKEKEALFKLKNTLESEIKRSESLLNNPSFTAKAPEQKLQLEKEKYESYQKQYEIVLDKLKSYA
jgi:ABC-type lipoprotein release transport system permease subunit